jgi:hypothetical protein
VSVDDPTRTQRKEGEHNGAKKKKQRDGSEELLWSQGSRDGREKDVGGGMTNENDRPRIHVGIAESTHNASTSEDTTKGGTNGKGGGEELTLSSVDHSPACCLS